MQSDVIRLVTHFDDAAIVILVGHEVKTVGVDKQDAHIVLLLTQKVKIALLDVVEIGIADFLLVATPTLADVGLQTLVVGIEIDQLLGFRHI